MNKRFILGYDFNAEDYYPILTYKKELTYKTYGELLSEAYTACNYHDYVCLIDSDNIEKVDEPAFNEVQAYSIVMYKGHKI